MGEHPSIKCANVMLALNLKRRAQNIKSHITTGFEVLSLPRRLAGNGQLHGCPVRHHLLIPLNVP